MYIFSTEHVGYSTDVLTVAAVNQMQPTSLQSWLVVQSTEPYTHSTHLNCQL